MPATQRNLLVSHADPKQAKWETATVPTTSEEINPGEALLVVETLALTANVFGYAFAGKSMGYYDFFPRATKPASKAEEAFGRVPTWGLSRVVASKSSLAPVGMRVYGLVPLSKVFVVQPVPVSPQAGNQAAWVDAAAHRSAREAIYNTYVVASAATDVLYPGPDLETEMLLMRPLFLTAFLLREAVWTQQQTCTALVITSASSKTGYALAALARARREAEGAQGAHHDLVIVGITSATNAGFTTALNAYDAVLRYDSPRLDADVARFALGKNAVVVDLGGNIGLLRRLQRFTEPAAVHGEGFEKRLTKPAFFFAPKFANALVKRVGSAEFERRVASEFREFLVARKADLRPRVANGSDEVRRVYEAYANGKVPASESWLGVMDELVGGPGGSTAKL